ncbi:MAG: acyl dehydratase [Chloroflexi bacterium]|nr:acyl dehydratase [Chloroflexota bacterium]
MKTEPRINLSSLQEGMPLPKLTKEIRQENINLYAKASKDFNPIHIDEEFARKTPLGGTIAHGMLVLAYIAEMMTGAFGEDWITGGKLSVRFKSPARPGDTVTVSGKVRKIERTGGKTVVHCDALCLNQSGETIIAGESSVALQNR